MPPRASTSRAAEVDAADDDDDFVLDVAEDDSGDEFMAAGDADVDDGRHFTAARRRAAAAAKGKGRGVNGSASSSTLKPSKGSKDASKSYAWESTFQRSWDAVGEDESGSLEASVKHLLAAGKRKRAAREERRVRRGIIRHLVLVLDTSENMNEKDGGRGTRMDVLLPIARRFVSEYFEQNPIGQLAILAMRDGIADRLVPMGGNTAEHLAVLNNRRRIEPRGDPSLQNALEMAKSTLAHLPMTSSREILLISGSLTSCDPGNIHHTMSALKAANIRVDLIHLTAEMKILRDIAQETGGTYGVALDEGHLEELIREGVRPREILKKERDERTGAGGDGDEDEDEEGGAELMQMGFPLRLPTHAPPTLCACHSRLYPAGSDPSGKSKGSNSGALDEATAGFLCPRCGVKICDVPTDCPVCGLTVVMSTHLARSYRHLFPVRRFIGVTWDQVLEHANPPLSCTGCDEAFEPIPTGYQPKELGSGTTAPTDATGLSESGRYVCQRCHNWFCLDCDAYVHEELHVCPACG